MERVKHCAKCKREFPKNSKEIVRSPIAKRIKGVVSNYLCLFCVKINPCGNPFCPPGSFHEH